MDNILIQDIIGQLKAVQDNKLWVGNSFSNKLESIEGNVAFIRPIETLHSVAEILSHLTLWRKETILKIKTGTGSKTEECEENWLSNDQLKIKSWKALQSSYRHTLVELISLLNDKTDAFLDQEYYDTDFEGTYPYRFVLHGMLHHDLYHLGQLGIIIKLLKEKGDLQ